MDRLLKSVYIGRRTKNKKNSRVNSAVNRKNFSFLANNWNCESNTILCLQGTYAWNPVSRIYMLWVCRIECTLLHGIQNHVPDGIMYVKVSCIMLLYLSTYMVSCIMYKSKNAKYPVSSTYVHGILYYVYMQSILYNVPTKYSMYPVSCSYMISCRCIFNQGTLPCSWHPSRAEAGTCLVSFLNQSSQSCS